MNLVTAWLRRCARRCTRPGVALNFLACARLIEVLERKLEKQMGREATIINALIGKLDEKDKTIIAQNGEIETLKANQGTVTPPEKVKDDADVLAEDAGAVKAGLSV